MSTIVTLASIAVGVAFVVAGGSKLAAGNAWPTQAHGLGSPTWVIPFVPWAELAIGAALIVGLVPPLPAAAALVMLVAFTALIGFNMSKGRRPPCACFGAWSSKPIGPGHLVRNAVLVALTIVALL
jgi:uncharacterized membrane protein YphA (DoxX/SURF4 family)